ncbi:hypothetical protein MK489_21610 [Myxococcota bacterium]|nr:hypothetical protein [Myxococcota bacterium]
MSEQSKIIQWSGFALAASILAAHFNSFPIRDTAISTETKWWLYFSMNMTQGGVPHLDMFQIKNQLATFWGALLYQLGTWSGVEPLMVIRAGSLTLAAVIGLLIFSIHRHLGRGRNLNGWLGVLAYCAFPLLGALPAVGNRPKLVMSLMAASAALLVYRRKWFWAGVSGALAFMDWQIGVLVWLAAFVSALVHGIPRIRAALLVAGGAVATLLPFLVYYGVTGALKEVFNQVLVGAFLRGSGGFLTRFSNRLDTLSGYLGGALEGREWLLFFVCAGAIVAAWRLYREFFSAEGRLLLPLCIYHFAMTGYLLTDFQGQGDLFVLLHSLVFFLAMSWTWIADLCWRHRFSKSSPTRQWIFATATLLLGVSLAQPGPLKIPFDFTPNDSLTQQKRLSEGLRRRFEGQSILFLENSELAFLMGYSNPLPMVSLIPTAVIHYRLAGERSWRDTGPRLIRSIDPEAVLLSRKHSRLIEALHPEYRLEHWGPAGSRSKVYMVVRNPRGESPVEGEPNSEDPQSGET